MYDIDPQRTLVRRDTREGTVTEEPPTAVTDGETKAGAVDLAEGETALLTALRRDFCGNDSRQATAAGGAAVSLVATLEELATAADRKKGRLTSNHEHELLDGAGLALRVPPIWTTANDQGVYGFYGYQQAMLGTIATADTHHAVQLPPGERARRALSYVGAELIADRRFEEQTAESDPDDEEREAGDLVADDDRLKELVASVGFDTDSDPRAIVEWIDETLENGREAYIAARSGTDPTTEREDLRAARFKLNKRIHWLGLQVGEDRDGTEGSEASTQPEPTEGVLGYDWVRTGDHRWTGRPLRGLLYAVLTEADGLDLPADSVDRVELLNYGEPTVRAYEVPSDRRDLTLVSGDDPPGDPDTVDRHAVDFRVVGDFSEVDGLTEEGIENALRQHLNTLQLLARYDESVDTSTQESTEDDSGSGAEPSMGDEQTETAATESVGSAGMTDEAQSRTEDALLETPFDDLVPAGLRVTMDKVHHGWRKGEYDFDAYLTDGEIVGTSHSWETSR